MSKFLFLVILQFCIKLSSAQSIRTADEIARRDHMLRHADAFADLFISEFVNYTRTGIRTEQYDGMVKMMQIPKEFSTLDIDEMEPEAAIMSCLACRTTFGLMISQYRSGSRTKEQLISDSITLCGQLTSFSIIVCEGAVRKYAVSTWNFLF